MPKNNILVFNCGSSSIKFTVINHATGEQALSGIVENINTGNATITLKVQQTKLLDKEFLSDDDYEYALHTILSEIDKVPGITDSIAGVGHRVVHGGEYFNSSVVIKSNVIANIEDCSELAPLHNPANLTGIKIAMQKFDKVKHIACFDTAFHQTMPKWAYIYPVPYSWYQHYKVRRYGFHGMSHKYVSMKAAEFLNIDLNNSNFITAHLGNGCSATAVKNGHSVDTTMGLTPLEGLMMGTRSGSIDPSIVFYVSEKLEITEESAFNLLNKNSGLLGVSELSMDLRILEDEAAKGHEQAQLSIDLFCYILAKALSSLTMPLGKLENLDAIIFTGGIGENSDVIRGKTIELLANLNLQLDQKKNTSLARGSSGNIAKENAIPILVIPTNEELMIAKEASNLI